MDSPSRNKISCQDGSGPAQLVGFPSQSRKVFLLSLGSDLRQSSTKLFTANTENKVGRKLNKREVEHA